MAQERTAAWEGDPVGLAWLHRWTCLNWRNQARINGGQGGQHETALIKAWVGKVQHAGVAAEITAPQEVEIQAAGSPMLEPLAAELRLQSLQGFEQGQGRSKGLALRRAASKPSWGFHHHGPIQVGRLAGRPAHRFGAKQR